MSGVKGVPPEVIKMPYPIFEPCYKLSHAFELINKTDYNDTFINYGKEDVFCIDKNKFKMWGNLQTNSSLLYVEI